MVFKGGMICCVALLILSGFSGSNLLLAIILGFICFLTGLFVTASAWVVRYPYWRRAMIEGIFQISFAIFLFQPFPTHHDGTIPQFIGMMMLLSSLNCIFLSIRLLNLGHRVTIFDVQSTKIENIREKSISVRIRKAVSLQDGNKLTVHIWTPEGSSDGSPIPRPLLNRYIAAVDTNGVISTGHAALEMNDIYISLYPSVEIDRSPSEFFRTLRAVRENDMRGEFQKDYISEAEAWCDSDRQVNFYSFNEETL